MKCSRYMAFVIYVIYRYFLLICGSGYSFNLKYNYIFRIELWEVIVGGWVLGRDLIHLTIILHLRLEQRKSSLYSWVICSFSYYANNMKLVKEILSFPQFLHILYSISSPLSPLVYIYKQGGEIESMRTLLKMLL